MVTYNRRAHPRINLSVNEKCYFEYRKAGKMPSFLTRPTCVLAVNISGAGITFLSQKYIAPNTVFNVQIRLLGNYKPINCQTTVVRCDADKKNQNLYQVGIQYIKINKEDRLTIIHFCEKRFDDLKKQLNTQMENTR
ncbi:MAG: PilZ domain-containing protein [Candidatus Aureabacteria bacterium]|nr:PilZ domain-containing protein [Candidatus Auribacterota bacterium]